MEETEYLYPPIKIGKIEIASKDWPEWLNWKDTNELISEIGDGWRLPTPEEALYFIDLCVNLGIGEFSKWGNKDRRGYWTQSEDFKGSTQLRTGLYIDHKSLYGYNIANPCLIRLVRDLE
jgi:hypothetical protein